jgi:hypothetical protein
MALNSSVGGVAALKGGGGGYATCYLSTYALRDVSGCESKRGSLTITPSFAPGGCWAVRGHACIKHERLQATTNMRGATASPRSIPLARHESETSVVWPQG